MPQGLRVTTEDSLSREAFLAPTPEGVLLATELAELVSGLGATAARPSPFGVSHTLNTGFVPLPHTIYDGVFRLGAGDTAFLGARSGATHLQFESDYPWLAAKSRQDQQPSTDHLYSLIVASVARQLEACAGTGVLMMSSGKDSVSLAVALAETGYDVPAITYRASVDNLEHEFAAGFCKKLGLRHRTIDMPSDPIVVRRHLTTFFENAVAPCTDHAMIPMIIAVAESGVRVGGIVDGSGNDSYMGYLPSRDDRIKMKYRVRGRWLAKLVAQATRVDSKINYLARPKSSTTIPGRRLRPHETRSIYREAIDTDDYWYEHTRHTAGLSDLDATALGLIRLTEGAFSNDKVRWTAQALGMKALLPFCDPDLAAYCFNLPVQFRYNEETRTNKVLLRQLLAEKIGYDEEVVGKGFFAFDGAAFMEANADFVRDEINSCRLWAPAIVKHVDEWLAAIPRRPFLFHVLLPLFVVSGWHNHSRFLTR